MAVIILWIAIVSACLTLAAVHFLVWCQRRAAWDDLLFTVTSVAVAAFATGELLLFKADTPAEYAAVARWIHIPGWCITISLAGFVWLHLRAGRRWLLWSVCGLRTVALFVNFVVGESLNYSGVTGLRQAQFLGDVVSIGVGKPNPWMLVGQASLLLLVVFTFDAAVSVWRRGDRRLALLTGGSIVLFTTAALTQVVLVLWGLVDWPFAFSPFFMGIVAAMAVEASGKLVRAERDARELLESERRLTLAADAGGVGLWTRDLRNDEIWASERWRTLFGFTATEPLRFDRVLGRLHPDDRDPLRRAIGRAVEDRGSYSTEYRVELPDGSTRWIGSSGTVESNDRLEPVLVRGASVDITRRRQSEADRRELQQELAHAGRVNLLGQLATSIAHELGQPLGAILRNAETAQILLDSPSPDIEELRAIVADIRNDDRRAVGVLDHLRSLLRRRSPDFQSIPTCQLVDDVVTLVRSDASTRRVTLPVDVPGDLPAVRGDRVHLQQVLLNLIMNAMDAVASEPPECRKVTLSARANGQGMVEVAVCDSGTGIPATQMESLFRPFHTTKQNGMGMGLSISRTIVEAHGGEIRAENNAARGATFRFKLPVAGPEAS